MILLSRYEKGHLNAGPKAKTDIEKILKKEFNSKILTISERANCNKFIHLIYKIIAFIYPFLILNKNELVIIQFPFANYKISTHRLKNKIAFIHDLNGLRYNDEYQNKKDIEFLKDCRLIVAHNNKMVKFLVDNGINKEKILCNELFDYLTKDILIEREFNIKDVNIAYAGNLSNEKSPFLYQLDCNKMEFSLVLYGVGISKDINNKEIYDGKYDPDELPNNINADLGLVWDGNLDSTDENSGFKNYTKYNNPHKLSCYIAAGIPVIVWSKAACSEFVKKNKIGYLINDLYDINNLDFSDYDIIRNNVLKIRNKVIKGEYTKRVIEKVLKD